MNNEQPIVLQASECGGSWERERGEKGKVYISLQISWEYLLLGQDSHTDRKCLHWGVGGRTFMGLLLSCVWLKSI